MTKIDKTATEITLIRIHEWIEWLPRRIVKIGEQRHPQTGQTIEQNASYTKDIQDLQRHVTRN
jgi:hypothetical protein